MEWRWRAAGGWAPHRWWQHRLTGWLYKPLLPPVPPGPPSRGVRLCLGLDSARLPFLARVHHLLLALGPLALALARHARAEVTLCVRHAKLLQKRLAKRHTRFDKVYVDYTPWPSRRVIDVNCCVQREGLLTSSSVRGEG